MTTTTDLTIRPFEVHMPEEDLADLRRRVAAVRLPSKELVDDRSQGGQLATIQELARYWTTSSSSGRAPGSSPAARPATGRRPVPCWASAPRRRAAGGRPGLLLACGPRMGGWSG